MDRSLPLPLVSPAAGLALLRRLALGTSAAWHRATLDDDERFLRGAQDLGDLERRMRQLERGRADRFGLLDPGA